MKKLFGILFLFALTMFSCVPVQADVVCSDVVEQVLTVDETVEVSVLISDHDLVFYSVPLNGCGSDAVYLFASDDNGENDLLIDHENTAFYLDRYKQLPDTKVPFVDIKHWNRKIGYLTHYWQHRPPENNGLLS